MFPTTAPLFCTTSLGFYRRERHFDTKSPQLHSITFPLPPTVTLAIAIANASASGADIRVWYVYVCAALKCGMHLATSAGICCKLALMHLFVCVCPALLIGKKKNCYAATFGHSKQASFMQSICGVKKTLRRKYCYTFCGFSRSPSGVSLQH